MGPDSLRHERGSHDHVGLTYLGGPGTCYCTRGARISYLKAIQYQGTYMVQLREGLMLFSFFGMPALHRSMNADGIMDKRGRS